MEIIYQPKGRAYEYAPLAANLYSGCSHGCRYCYVPTIPPWKSGDRAAFHADPKPRANVLKELEKQCAKQPGNGRRVLMSFTTDPYQQIDERYHLTRQAIRILHAGGYNVEILTKGGFRALHDIDIFTANDRFATTMTLLDPVQSAEWEPQAALPGDRIYTLDAFHSLGVPTWVSLEPVLDPAAALQIIRETHTFTDLYKIGKLNHHPAAAGVDWRAFAIAAIELCEALRARYYVKIDLAEFVLDVPWGKWRVAAEEIR